jgi:hypothetical protein
MIGAMALYFAYGSNMSSARLAARVPAARALGAVYVRDFRLAFNKPGRDGTGKANLVSASGERAWGVAWALSDLAWNELDVFEPGYRRVSCVLSSVDGRTLAAEAYVFPAPADAPLLAPSADYVTHLVAGAREHGLPETYVRWLSGFAPPDG